MLKRNEWGDYIVPADEWHHMRDELLWLYSLEVAGVDNWEGIDEAKEIYQEKRERAEDF